MSCTLVEVTFLGTDNPNSAIFSQTIEGVKTPFDFNDPVSATRIVVSFKGETVIADATVSGPLIDWETAASIGELVFNFNDLAITKTDVPLPATIRVFDTAHLNGQILVHEDDGKLSFKFSPVPAVP